eukprot:gene10656-3280_t
MLKILGFLLLVNCVFSTFYLTAYDKKTKEWGQAAASSGFNSRLPRHWYQHKVIGKGMAGEQAYTLRGCSNVTKWIDAGLSAPDVASKVKEECDARRWTHWRLAVATSDGKVAAMLGKDGCHRGNQLCGVLNDKNFVIVGGGLKAGVLEAGLKAWKKTDPKLQLTCRLFIALKGVFDAGAEIKPLFGASLSVDGKSSKPLYIRSTVSSAGNEKLLKGLYDQLPASCKTYLILKNETK